MAIQVNNRKFRIIKRTGEFIVRVTEGGVWMQDADYYTDDLEDARATLRAMVCRYAFETCNKGTFRVVHR